MFYWKTGPDDGKDEAGKETVFAKERPGGREKERRRREREEEGNK